MTCLQLNPQIPLDTPRGRGQAIVLIDYSEEHDLMWVVIQDSTGEIWTYRNTEVRGIKNATMGRLMEPNDEIGTGNSTPALTSPEGSERPIEGGQHHAGSFLPSTIIG